MLFEAEKTCDFICQLSSYLPQWRVSSPESVHQLQVFPRPLGQFLFIPLILMVALPSVWLKFNKYVLELSKCVFKNLNAT